MGTDYDVAFYDAIAAGSTASAAVVVPLVMARYTPRTVLDIGCGRGWWGRKFADHGCDVSGLDGDYVTDPVIPVTAHDLTQPLPDRDPVDLVVCLEVAEHLPAHRAAGFVADLCRLGRRVLFSAAIPHQTGAGHINCQWPAYWAALFADHGYGVADWLRWRIWDDDTVEPWYRQNVMVYDPNVAASVPPGVVHPVIHSWGR